MKRDTYENGISSLSWLTWSLNKLMAKLPFSEISTMGPYLSRILKTSFWLAGKMSKITLLGVEIGLTALDSNAGMSADEVLCRYGACDLRTYAIII